MTRNRSIDSMIRERLAPLSPHEKLGTEDARNVYDTVLSNRDPQSAERILLYFEHFDAPAKALLALLFDPRITKRTPSPNIFQTTPAQAAPELYTPHAPGRNSVDDAPLKLQEDLFEPASSHAFEELLQWAKSFQGLLSHTLLSSKDTDRNSLEQRYEAITRHQAFHTYLLHFARTGTFASLERAMHAALDTSETIAWIFARNDDELESLFRLRLEALEAGQQACELAATFLSEPRVAELSAQVQQEIRYITGLLSFEGVPHDHHANPIQASESWFERLMLDQEPPSSPSRERLEKRLVEGSMPPGTFQNILQDIQGITDSPYRLYAFGITKPERCHNLLSLCDYFGIRPGADRDRLLHAWISDHFQYPDWGDGSTPRTITTAKRLLHASIQRAEPLLTDVEYARLMDLMSRDMTQMTVSDAVRAAAIARVASFERTFTFQTFAAALLVSPQFSLFEGVLSPSTISQQAASIVVHATALYLEAHAERLQQATTFTQWVEEGSTGLTTLEHTADALKHNETLFSPEAAQKAEEAADALEPLMHEPAIGSQALSLVRASLYHFAIECHPRDAKWADFSARIRQKIYLIDGPQGSTSTPPSPGTSSETRSLFSCHPTGAKAPWNTPAIGTITSTITGSTLCQNVPSTAFQTQFPVTASFIHGAHILCTGRFI